MMLLNIAIIWMAFVGAHAEKEIDYLEEMAAFNCAGKMMTFVSRVGDSDWWNEGQMKELKNLCDNIKYCSTTYGHYELLSNEDSKFLFKIIKSYCGVLNRVEKNWNGNPFLDNDDCEDKKKVTEVCKDFFGKDQCLKKKILEHCNKKDWEGFLDHFIALYIAAMKQRNLKMSSRFFCIDK